MASDFGTAKSVFILAIVAGCFAILWPNVFYPMITGNYQPIKTEEKSNGCCDVIFDNDINGIKIMTELCEKILKTNDLHNETLLSFTQAKLSKNTIQVCVNTVLEKCDLDITVLLSKNIALGKDYKQTMDLLRTLNSSICLRESFGVSLGQVGLPRRMRVWGLNMSKHMKPERPPHLHPEMMHPALREKGRAIQQSQKAPPEERPATVAGMRPTLGGAGHVVPPPKGGGTMGIVMPMYTIGIVIFFLYTMLKLLFKKSGDSQSYEELSSDADFQRDVFGLNQDFVKDKSPDTTRLVTSAFSGLLQEVNKQISEQIRTIPDSKEEADASKEEPDKINKDDTENNQGNAEKAETELESDVLEGKDTIGAAPSNDESAEAKAGVKVIGMETTESCEGGKWSRPETPRPATPQNIYLPAVLADQSKIIVTNSSTETFTLSEDNNAPVVLSGKVTLSLIGIQDSGILDSNSKTDEAHSDLEGSKVSSENSSVTDPLVDIIKNNDQLQLNVNEDKSLVSNG